MHRRRKIRLFALIAGIILLIAIGRPVLHVARTAYLDKDKIGKLPAGYAGIYPDGITINVLPLKGMELDTTRNVLHVQVGARWADIIPYLDRHGRSIEVMQSDDAFTVGGSLSVNCHGWQYGRPPIASTVESFRLMRADGTVVRCSRSENPELFSLALGGYGLFGVILDADLRVVPNERLRLEQLRNWRFQPNPEKQVSIVYAFRLGENICPNGEIKSDFDVEPPNRVTITGHASMVEQTARK